MHRSTLTADLLDASTACCELYVARGSTKLTVAEIAEHIGISVRTFHRYFATKADTVSPLFREKSRALNDYVDRVDASPLDVFLVGGHTAMFGGLAAELTRNLFPLVFGDAEMWAVFLRALHEGDAALRPRFAVRLEIPSDHPRLAAATSVFTSANRIALEGMVREGRSSDSIFLETIAQFGPTPFLAPANGDTTSWPMVPTPPTVHDA